MYGTLARRNVLTMILAGGQGERLSPLTKVPIDSNVGGYFGPYLKFGGWDALEIQGKAEVETIVFIDSNKRSCEYLMINKLDNVR
jgi:hypothetical protein